MLLHSADSCSMIAAHVRGQPRFKHNFSPAHRPSRPGNLTLVGQPVWTGGDFPLTVAVSADLGIACVGNAGANSGVACIRFDENGLTAFDEIRPLPMGQTTPPVGPGNGIADVLFNDDESALLVIVKGNNTAAVKGFIASYAVDASARQISYSDQEFVPDVARLMFGTTTIPGTRNILVSDAGFGAMIFSVDDLSWPIAITNITNQVATCWAVISPVSGTGFVDDIIVSQLVEIDLASGAIVSVADPKNVGQGMLDMSAVGDKIYSLSPGNGTVPAAVTVFDVSGGRGSVKAIQNFVIDGADQNAAGLSVYFPGSSC